MDANIDNGEENDDHQHLAAEQEQQQIADAAAAAAADERLLKLISVLERKSEFHLQSRTKIDILVEQFLDKTEDDIFKCLCDNNSSSPNLEDYSGLDSDRDTEEEVGTAIRFFPNVLSRRKEIVFDNIVGEWIDMEGRGDFPIQCILFLSGTESYRCNVEAVSFIPLLVRLAIELGSFEERYRGGLLCKDNDGDNVLEDLMNSDTKEWVTFSDMIYENQRRDYHEHRDDKYFQVLVQLRKMGLFKKEDIQEYNLLNKLCSTGYFFPDKRFRLLVEWDPIALIQPNDDDGYLPLHYAAWFTSIRGFQIVLEYGIRYYPKKIGIRLLFQKNIQDDTPFQDACEQYGNEKVMKVVEDTLIRYSDTPLNITEVLVMAAIDETIHLDCVYFLLRREPDILQKILSSTPAVMDSSTSSNKANRRNRRRDSSKKRKRER